MRRTPTPAASRRLVLIAALAGLLSCAPGQWKRAETLVSQPGLVVQIEGFDAREDIGELGFAHPATVDAAELEALLRATSYTRKADGHGGEVLPLFPSDRAGELAAAMVEGFAHADGSQRVRFSVTFKGDETGPWFVPHEHRTRGTAFVRPEGVLNIAFDLVDELVDDRRGAGKDPTDQRRSRDSLIPPEGAALHRTPAGERMPLWLTWTLPGSRAASAKSSVDAPTAEAETQPVAAPADTETLIRLRQLEELHSDGVIDEAEFDRRRQRLLFGEELEPAAPREEPADDSATEESG